MDMLKVWECRGGRGCVGYVWLVEEMMMRMRTMTCMDMGYNNHSEDSPPQEYWRGPGRATSPFAIVKGKRASNHQ